MSAAADTLPPEIEAVVIGASAGGVEALSALLPALPASLRVPVFVVVHLPRERPSLLANIFAARCAVTVSEAQDKEPVRAGHVYFGPPDYHLLIDRSARRGQGLAGHVSIALSADEPVNFSRPAIDVLFESAADVYGPCLAGIILTGANHDGAAGLRAVAQAGGLALVQTPQSAQASLMPESAIKLTPTARVRSLQELAALLTSLGADPGNPLT